MVHKLVENEEQDKPFINKTKVFVSSSNSIRSFKRKWHHLRYRVSKLPVRLWNSFGIIKLLLISVLFPQYLCLIFMKYFNFYINSWFLLILSGLFCQKYSFNFVLLFVDLAPIFFVFFSFSGDSKPGQELSNQGSLAALVDKPGFWMYCKFSVFVHNTKFSIQFIILAIPFPLSSGLRIQPGPFSFFAFFNSCQLLLASGISMLYGIFRWIGSQ